MFSARSRCSRRETLCVSARDRHVSPYHPSRLERAEVDQSRLRLRTSDPASPAAHVSSDDQTAVTFLAEIAEDISQKIAESFFLKYSVFLGAQPSMFSARSRCSRRETLCVSARDRPVNPYHPSRPERAEVDQSRLRLGTSDQASPAAHVSSDDQT